MEWLRFRFEKVSRRLRRVLALCVLVGCLACTVHPNRGASPYQKPDHFLNVVYTRGGALRADRNIWTPEDQIAEFGKDPTQTLVIHFHGGLVTEAAALQEADDLGLSCYGDPDLKVFPLFLLWDSGWPNTLNEMTSDVLNPSGQRALNLFVQKIAGSMEQGKVPSILRLAATIAEIQNDAEYRRDLSNEKGHHTPNILRADWLMEHMGELQGFADWMTTAPYPWVPLGPRAACFEFLTRLIAKDGWDRMKADGARLCEIGGPIDRIVAAINRQVPPQSHIVLVGHSAGCFLIDLFLQRAHALMPTRKFDVVWMAPAISYRRVAANMDVYRQSVLHFKEFNLDAKREMSNHMLSDIGQYRSDAFPGSLLLYVSGALEGRPDTPIVGLERFQGHPRQWTPSEGTAIDSVMRVLNLGVNTYVSAPGSTDCTALRHGDFIEDPATQQTLHRLLTEWKDPASPDGLLP
jgi:hypothetical protein